VPGGGESSRLATYLKAYLDAHPTETLSIVSHSQGGVLSAYTVKQKLSASYTSRIRAIVTYDSPLRGINATVAQDLKNFSCGDKRFDSAFDSAYDMQPSSDVIKRINDAYRPSTYIYTVDADPGSFEFCPGCPVALIDDYHSTTWWARSHIRVKAATHSAIWYGGLAAADLHRLLSFTACAVGGLSADCAAYSGA